jgi:hypothetical protein
MRFRFIELTFPKWNAFSCTMPLLCGPINALSPAVSLFSHPTRGSNAISDLRGVGNVVLCLFGTHSNRPVEPHSFGFG